MNTKPMINAICNTTTNLRQVETVSHLDAVTVRDAVQLLCALRRLMEGDPAIAAFGELSSWRRDSEIRAALGELRRGTCAAKTPAPPVQGAVWVYVMSVLNAEIAVGRFNYPHKFEQLDHLRLLCVRTSHVVAHFQRTPTAMKALGLHHARLPTDRMLKKLMVNSGVVLTHKDGASAQPLERTFDGHRVAHMTGVLLDDVCAAAESLGLQMTAPFRAQ